MRALITQDYVARKLPRRAVDVRDVKLGGFLIRCRPSGRHSYLVVLGRGRVVTIGRVKGADAITAAAARTAAEKLKGDVGHEALVAVAADPALTLADARKKARASVVARRRQRRRSGTFGAYLTDHYGPWVKANRKTGEETLDRLEATFAAMLTTPLAELAPFAIEKWRSTRLKAGRTPSTVNRDLAALRGALSKAVEWGLLAAHPLATVKAAKVDATGHVRFLSADEATRLTAALTARDDRRRAERVNANAWRRERGYEEWPALGKYTDHVSPVTLLALNTGCRRGELLALRWDDVDMGGARLTVRASGAKSGLSRVIPLNSEALAVLKAWRPHADLDDGARVPGRRRPTVARVQGRVESRHDGGGRSKAFAFTTPATRSRRTSSKRAST